MLNPLAHRRRFLTGAVRLGLIVFMFHTALAGDIRGTVTDRRQAPLPGAVVSLSPPDGQGVLVSIVTDKRGQFSLLQVPPGAYVLRATAHGFKSETIACNVSTATAEPIHITLQIAAPSETITVTATRSEQTVLSTSASVTVFDDQDVSRSPGQTVDEVLRQMPGFSLFRRAGSLASHPTAQGVSLRGIGPSGASRTLVLLDGLPINDLFGGWVYWSRLPVLNLEKIEIVEGGHSSLYGNYALGGIINMTSRRPERRTAAVRGQFGNQNTAQTEFFAGDKWGRLGAAVQGQLFSTQGYPIVAKNTRGAIDTHTRTGFGTLNLKLSYDLSPQASLFLDGNFFDERRKNGTREQRNGTVGKYFAARGRVRTGDGSQWQAALFSNFQSFNSTFSAIANDRNRERLTLAQNVPSQGTGASAQWSKRISNRHELAVGTDFLWVRGDSREQLFDPSGTRVDLYRVAGGRQRSLGGFAQDVITLTEKWQLDISARIDRWRNYDGSQTDISATSGSATRLVFSEKSNTLMTTRISARYLVNDRLSLWSSFYKAFRAPTLNELYRQFRVGNVQTLANSQLGPERVTEGTEIGVKSNLTRSIYWSASGFVNRVKDPITNATLSVRPDLITRQRQNLGRTHIRGFETQLEYQASPRWLLAGRYLFDQAQVAEFRANRALEGLVIPQVPRHQLALQARYTNSNLINAAAFARWIGRQFDDDLNRFSLDRFFLLDFTVSRFLNKNWEAFVAVENAFNRTYMVGMTPTPMIGAPRRVHGGLRFALGI
ncbi:MAG: TonB-dependent receptor [Acidobacteria bacterium]|nr:TonB-dependent receptor [Acidobacteriota bacterium]MBI3658135.1 TonB-dependent receptor [Acidobacteriota bacterium]